ncbi:conserved hypothetical protein [Theileria equi strain WA]|uniref:Uncharacterized protein n=1 Tax=Theileria equi strain WA TaxID=1537102 RepID=L1LFI1_THEEQ|nr:conserved hypothetical protein [Theileria equi strain WA]EKX73908.1 conserved hypothetical protein [Theileria equi strain WA]|eukprot:XP_004833360.1 conserved hypothetical protein [Theileria equi strain WA]
MDEIFDNLTFQEIEAIIDNLSHGNLSSFVNNDQLNEALDKDAYIISNVSTQTGITKACEHGVKLSSIIKHKASKLNESTILELLDQIIAVLVTKFGKSVKQNALSSSQDQNTLELRSSQLNDITNCVDFVGISKYFPSKVLSFSSLSWDTLPLNGLISNETLSQTKRKRTTTVVETASKKELSTMVEYDENLETKRHVEEIQTSLRESTLNGPVRFWDFILDRDPVNGFNNTCYNLYSLTFLATSGDIELFEGPDKQIMLQASQDKGKRGENAQSVISGWSYDRWLALIKEYP